MKTFNNELNICTKEAWEAFYHRPIQAVFSLAIDNRQEQFEIDYDLVAKYRKCYCLDICDQNHTLKDLRCLAGNNSHCISIYSPELTLEGASEISKCFGDFYFKTDRNNIDIEPVAQIKGLFALSLDIPDLKEFRVLQPLSELGVLMLFGRIENISCLADFQCIKNGGQFMAVYLDENLIEDISPLASVPVEQLYLNNNRIQDVSSVAQMLKYNQSWGNGFQLDLTGNPISQSSKSALLNLFAECGNDFKYHLDI